MTRCLTTEQLSAWLDHEVVRAAEARRIASHLSTCPACRQELASLERGALALQQLPRAEPPAWLAARVRERIARAEVPVTPWRRLSSYCAAVFSRLSPQVLAPTLSAAVVAMIFLAVGAPNLTQLLPWRKQLEPHVRVKVTVTMGEDIPIFQPTTQAQVAGRTFDLVNEAVWMEQGIRLSSADLRVEAGSAAGRAILARNSGIAVLLEDDMPVVFRDDQRRTVELVRSL